jgi:parallel beta-helix repeat protein
MGLGERKLLRKTVSGIMVTLLLAGMLTLAFNVQPAKASGTIYIRADGSIDPPTAPISSVDNVTYIFTGNINDSIVVERNNIVVDGAGYTVQGTGSGDGISLFGRINVTIKDARISNFDNGISIYYSNSSSNSIFGNYIANNNKNGVFLAGGSNYSINGNNIANNFNGILLKYPSNSSISENNITTSNFAGIYGYYSSSNNISGNNVTSSNFAGIYLDHSLRYSISGNSITVSPNYGILLDHSIYDSIVGNYIANNGMGIEVSYSDRTNVSENDITANYEGMILLGSSYNILRDNVMAGNEYNFGVTGSLSQLVSNDVDTSNSVDGKSILYLINQQDVIIDPDLIYPSIGYLAVINSTNITIRHLNLEKNYQGILLAYTKNSLIQDITVFNNEIGVDLEYSSYNSVSGNSIASNWWGIFLGSYSNYNSISGNSITNNEDGVYLYPLSNSNSVSGNSITANNGNGVYLDQSSSNSISGSNMIANNGKGIRLDVYSNNNTISENNITGNVDGIYLYYSSNNSVFHNNFVGNQQPASTYESYGNLWDDGYPSGGNYWSDYSGVDVYRGPYQNETGSDGIGDISYVVDANNTDRYPLMNLWSPHDIAVLNVTPSKTVVGQGYTMSINVTVENQGKWPETFNVTSSAFRMMPPAITIATLTVYNLAPETWKKLILTWNTAGFAKGNYTISAYAWPVPGETDLADNRLTDGWVMVTWQGDVTDENHLTPPGGVSDGKVDENDLWYFDAAFIDYYKIHRLDANCDFNNDGKIDEDDLWTFCGAFIDYWKAH